MNPYLVLPEMQSDRALVSSAIPAISTRRRRDSNLKTAAVSAGPRILLVDDDPAILHLTETVLAASGYRVCSATDASRALAVLRQHADINLLLTDVNLSPGISGLELAEIVTTQKPTLPVVIISGDIMTAEQAALMRHRSWAFVDKPLLMPRLLSVISIVLRRPAVRVAAASIELPRAG